MKKNIKIILSVLGLTTLLIAYNNCGEGFQSTQTISSSTLANSPSDIENCDGFPNGFNQIDPVDYFSTTQGADCTPKKKQRVCNGGQWSNWTNAGLSITSCTLVVETCDGLANNFVQVDPLNYYLAEKGVECNPIKKQRTCNSGQWSNWTNAGLSLTSCTVVINDPNQAPTAKIKLSNGNPKLGETVEFDGSESTDFEKSNLTYAWIIEKKPTQSLSSLSPLNENKTKLVIDQPGPYEVSLIVSDGNLQSQKTKVEFTVLQPINNTISLINSSLVDGSKNDQVRDVATDNAGNIYVTGGTGSNQQVATAGSFDTTFNTGGNRLGSLGEMDVFVSKYSPNGQLLWSTYLGRPNYDLSLIHI